MGFVSMHQRDQHFAKHGADFGVTTAAEYEKLADTFLGGSSPSGGTQQCARPRGDLVRFDPATDAYGVLGHDKMIRTFFKPIPCAAIPVDQRISMKHAGRCHAHSTNLLYFQSECNRQW